MTPAPTKSTELVDRAVEIYERDLKVRLEPAHVGKYLILDVDTGDYELGVDHLATARTLRARRPQGNLVALRVGYPAAGRFGFRPRR